MLDADAGRLRTVSAIAALALAALAAVWLAPLGALAAPATAPAGSAPGGQAGGQAQGGQLPSLLASSDLWATIDVCSPADQPDWVGVRGSMPGDGHARDRMYMAFRLQYRNTGTGARRWVDIPGAGSSFAAVGSGASARQGGTSFELSPRAASFTLRGVVSFQWRRGATVLESVSRATTASHRSVSGADPPGYSAGTCVIG